MKELRCLVFTEPEVANAILDWQRRRGVRVPAGRVTGVEYDTANGLLVVILFDRTDGEHDRLSYHEDDVIASLITFCVNQRIPLPVESEKFVYLVNGNLTLMITMNFNRQPRYVFGNGEGDGRARRLQTSRTQAGS